MMAAVADMPDDDPSPAKPDPERLRELFKRSMRPGGTPLRPEEWREM